MKYFVTGATGFIGGAVVRQLREAGHEVIALVRTPSKAGALRDLGVTLAEGDIIEKETMRAPMTGVDGAFHLAAWYKYGRDPKKLGEIINLDGTRNFLELMRELKTPKGVYTSTLAIYSDTKGRKIREEDHYRVEEGKHHSRYDRTKAKAHEIADEFIREGLPLVIVQPGLVYGPGDQSSLGQTIRMFLKRQLPVVPPGGGCWTHVEDSARGHILAMEKGRIGESYHLAGPCHRLAEGFKVMEQTSGIGMPVMRASPGMMRMNAGMMDVIGSIIDLPDAFTGEIMRSSSGTYWADDSKARNELGWQPRSMEDGIRETVEAEMKALGNKKEKTTA